jgi:hypothetical protein
MAKYRAPVFNVAAARAKPVIAIALEPMICHVRSLKCPDESEYGIVSNAAMRYAVIGFSQDSERVVLEKTGLRGQVSTRVVVLLKPSVSTTVG